jgi:hypothetical protein
MTSRYAKRAGIVRDEWGAEYPAATEISVMREPIDTGLVDHRGVPIMRLPEPVGYLRKRTER